MMHKKILIILFPLVFLIGVLIGIATTNIGVFDFRGYDRKTGLEELQEDWSFIIYRNRIDNSEEYRKERVGRCNQVRLRWFFTNFKNDGQHLYESIRKACEDLE